MTITSARLVHEDIVDLLAPALLQALVNRSIAAEDSSESPTIRLASSESSRLSVTPARKRAENCAAKEVTST